MKSILRGIKVIINSVLCLFLLMFILVFIIPNPAPKLDGDIPNSNKGINPFSLNNHDIIYGQSNPSKSDDESDDNKKRQAILDRARSMVEVKWVPKYNLRDKYALYIFIKGKTYYGIPYSMDLYQVTSANDFLSKINGSSVLYGNDCSGFVSTAWGIPRQTTLSLYNAVKNGTKIAGKTISQISWDSLKPGDAILIDNGKGKGHIMLYIDADKNNGNKIYVYEQNIQTIIPFEPIPVARKDARLKSTLANDGYIPIRIN